MRRAVFYLLAGLLDGLAGGASTEGRIRPKPRSEWGWSH